MNQVIQGIDWPNIVAGTLITVFIGITGFVVKQLWFFYLARRAVHKYGKGIWYSAEYDTKGNVPKDNRVTYLKVLLSPSFRGRIRVKSLEQLNLNDKAVDTGWIAEGRIVNGVLIGEWKSTIPDGLRFGTAMLRFLDNGRAVGYWIGVRAYDPPLYGYWIMSRDFDDLKAIVTYAVPPSSFDTIDVARKVADFERGSRATKI
jgi:hypothetical protein